MDFQDRIRIREAYRAFIPDLLKGIRKSPYDFGVDWIMFFTPIEENVWAEIRYLGLPLYPQFPVGRYFIDFADPIRKIGIEVDSWRWHQNIEKDRRRQKEIESRGWRIYRINSFQSYLQRSDFENEDGIIENMEKFLTGCAEGILFEIYNSIGFFDKKEEPKLKSLDINFTSAILNLT